MRKGSSRLPDAVSRARCGAVAEHGLALRRACPDRFEGGRLAPGCVTCQKRRRACRPITVREIAIAATAGGLSCALKRCADLWHMVFQVARNLSALRTRIGCFARSVPLSVVQ